MSLPAQAEGAGGSFRIEGDGILHHGMEISGAYRGRLIGVESEFFVVDRETLELRDCMSILAMHSQFGHRVKTEIIREQLEFCSDAFSSLGELEAQMRTDLREAFVLLDSCGATLLPIALCDRSEVTWSDDPRVEQMKRHLGTPFVRHAGTITADQINVGADDEVDAFRIFRRLRAILPEIVGLAAASPFRSGAPNGIACNRMAAYDEALSEMPELSGIPPDLGSLPDYAAFINAQPRFRHPRTYYAYLRPMPHRGVAAEIRCIDKQSSLVETMAIAALAKAVMCSPHALGWSARDLDAALAEARRAGVIDRQRTTALLDQLSSFLPENEVHYLAELSPEKRNAPERLLAGWRELGEKGMMRKLAESMRSDVMGS